MDVTIDDCVAEFAALFPDAAQALAVDEPSQETLEEELLMRACAPDITTIDDLLDAVEAGSPNSARTFDLIAGCTFETLLGLVDAAQTEDPDAAVTLGLFADLDADEAAVVMFSSFFDRAADLDDGWRGVLARLAWLDPRPGTRLRLEAINDHARRMHEARCQHRRGRPCTRRR